MIWLFLRLCSIEKRALNNIAYEKTVLHCNIACRNSGKTFLHIFDPSWAPLGWKLRDVCEIYYISAIRLQYRYRYPVQFLIWILHHGLLRYCSVKYDTYLLPRLSYSCLWAVRPSDSSDCSPLYSHLTWIEILNDRIFKIVTDDTQALLWLCAL